jgi:acetyl-CoA carboxylase/biotin carboxylase 1
VANYCRPTTKVALRAREVLVLGSLPTFEERSVQMEKILKASVTESYYGEGASGHRLVVDVLPMPADQGRY